MVNYRLRPSKAPQWVHCAGSVVLQEQFPETERSEVAEEGTASHWVAESVLSTGAAYVGQFVGRTAPNGVIITEDMTAAAREYIEDVAGITPLVDAQVEQTIPAPRIHSECGGTGDCRAFNPTTNTLHIWDYKYGWGIVEAYENWQTICYAVGLVDTLIAGGMREASITVDIRIVQPRPYHALGSVRSWKVNAVELRPYANTLHNAAAEALGPDPTTRAGAHCGSCSARHACPTLGRAAMAALDISGSAVPHVLNPAALGSELILLKLAYEAIKNKLTGYEAQALGLIKSGKNVPGWTGEPGKGNVTWDKSVGEVIALGDLFGKDLRKSDAAVTPNQAKKQGVPAEIVAAYSTVPQRGLKLVRDDKTTASRVFKQK